jgi:hypothetical protein
LEGDICIVGTVAAGISMALEWINTPYKEILPQFYEEDNFSNSPSFYLNK